MKMYEDLASWWPLISPVRDYQEEAGRYHELLEACAWAPGARLLELGSGGGCNAHYLKAHYALTLTDLSERMLAISRALNPDCEHLLGDMRSIRLETTFDRVFTHDAIAYMATEADLRATLATAFAHLTAGGVALFAPDYVRETFSESTDQGGCDQGPRGLRYLEWVYDPDPHDTTYLVDYAFILRDEHGRTRVEHDRHLEGLFSTQQWLQWLAEAGFRPELQRLQLDGAADHEQVVFLGVKPEPEHEQANQPRPKQPRG